ncbi:MAG: hypothetical protein GY913_02770 [Proteobacteria bacterium]|nr:hypothetical protein [Pseudomonadota bacterium]MCP4915821.1 hypothetical protein [Pseudomonadota bacterium]
MLGILDWGIGGLFSLRRARELCPDLDLVYLADGGNTPYGKQSRRELALSVERAIARLAGLGATQVLVACHSGSTALPDVTPAVPTQGVIAPEHVPAGRTALIGGARTVRSGRWRRALDRPVIQRIAQPLSAHIEAGRGDSDACRRDLDRILEPVRTVEVLVLACTHYVALSDAIQARCPGATLVDPALAVVEALPLSAGSGRLDVVTTGDAAAMRQVAKTVLGLDLRCRTPGS